MKVFSNETFRYDSSNINNVQCRECKRYDHYANQCANTLRKREEFYWVSWSDDEAECFEGLESSRKEKDDDLSDVDTAFHVTMDKTLSDDEEEDEDPVSNRYDFDYYSDFLCLNACVDNT